jgi:glycosyltransferase involved in cell wall biosynthesis
MIEPRDQRSILWHSNSPASTSQTGYANQSALFVPRLRDAGYRIACSCFWGVEGSVQQWKPDGGEPITLFPKGHIDFGADILPLHAKHWFGGDPRAGLTITLMDAWTMDPRRLALLSWAAYHPVDMDPVVLMQGGGMPVVFSRFGEAVLRAAGWDPEYVPHAVDTRTYHPMDRAEARRRFGIPEDTFVILWVAANKGNPSRKAFGEGVQAVAEFIKRRRPSEPPVLLNLHSEQFGVLHGVNLQRLCEAVGLENHQVVFPDQYAYHLGLPPEYLNTWYNIADVLISPSMGEGFGIPILEAQSAGTPVIVNDFSSMPELRGAGWLCRGQKWWVPAVPDNQGGFQMIPFVSSIVAALERAAHELRNPRRRQQLREDARTFALGYDADLVTERYWLPVLDRLFAKIEQRPARSYHEALARLQSVPAPLPPTWVAQEKPQPEPEPEPEPALVGPRPLRRREPVAVESAGVAE